MALIARGSILGRICMGDSPKKSMSPWQIIYTCNFDRWSYRHKLYHHVDMCYRDLDTTWIPETEKKNKRHRPWLPRNLVFSRFSQGKTTPMQGTNSTKGLDQGHFARSSQRMADTMSGSTIHSPRIGRQRTEPLAVACHPPNCLGF